MNKSRDTIIFVYNTNSGFFNKLSDLAHKSFSPSTYQCSLCKLTHGTFSAKEEWIRFIKELDIDVQFVYKNDLKIKGIETPVVLFNKIEGLEVLIDRITLNRIENLIELMGMIKLKIPK